MFSVQLADTTLITFFGHKRLTDFWRAYMAADFWRAYMLTADFLDMLDTAFGTNFVTNEAT